MSEPLFTHALVLVGDGVTPSKPAADLEETVRQEALDVPNRTRLVKAAHEPEERRPEHG
jgi:hypothetical protein